MRRIPCLAANRWKSHGSSPRAPLLLISLSLALLMAGCTNRTQPEQRPAPAIPQGKAPPSLSTGTGKDKGKDIGKGTGFSSPKYQEGCGVGQQVCGRIAAKGQSQGTKITYGDRCAMAAAGAELCHLGSCFEMCTSQYDPVCGVPLGGGFKTYSNACVRTRSCAQPAPASSCGLD